jgi:hypothetical protein
MPWFFTILIALRGSNCPIRKFVVPLNRKRKFAGNRSFEMVFFLTRQVRDYQRPIEPKRIVCLLEDSWQHFLNGKIAPEPEHDDGRPEMAE